VKQRICLVVGRRVDTGVLPDDQWDGCIQAIQATLRAGRITLKFAGMGQLWTEEGAPGQDAYVVVGEVDADALHAASTMLQFTVEDWGLEAVESVYEALDHVWARTLEGREGPP